MVTAHYYRTLRENEVFVSMNSVGILSGAHTMYLILFIKNLKTYIFNCQRSSIRIQYTISAGSASAKLIQSYAKRNLFNCT